MQEPHAEEENFKKPQRNKMIKKKDTLREELEEGHLSTFTKTVAVIRPDNFAKNEQATADNKFMNDAGLEEEQLILQVSLQAFLILPGAKRVRQLHLNSHKCRNKRGGVHCEGLSYS